MKRIFFWMMCLSVGFAELKINVLDATIKNKSLGNVEVIFQKQGESSVKFKTNANGEIKVNNPFGQDNSDVTMILKKDGYATLSAKCPCDGFVYAMSPVLKEIDSIRVVLQWGANPRDMDLHAYWGSLAGYERNKHVYFAQRQTKSSPIWLDVDDVDGYGPETITLNKREDGKDYIFFIHRYAGTSMDADRAKSLRVFVYVGSSLVRTYYLPQKFALGTMGYWVPFMIDSEGKIKDKNIFIPQNQVGDYNNFGRLFGDLAGSIQENYIPQIGRDDKARSKRLNQQGERSYHAKDYEQSIRYYLQAIDLDPFNGQIYSNLGLSYQKMNNRAEAVWANRKAIELASGKNASTIRANSYYNIAKMYEEQGQFQEALTNYQRAFDNNPKSVYTNAIDRMKTKLNR